MPREENTFALHRGYAHHRILSMQKKKLRIELPRHGRPASTRIAAPEAEES
jgi:hypothetical protein